MSQAKKVKNYNDLYKELCNLPNHVIGEILHGQLVISPRPAPAHARASSKLGGKISEPFDSGRGGPGGWWIIDEPEIHLKETVIVPDLARWKRDHLPKLPDKAYFEVAPDWVCEVLSPLTARYDRISKRKIYAENNVSHYWIIDPANKTLETSALNNKDYGLANVFGGDDKVSAPPFEAIELLLTDLWME